MKKLYSTYAAAGVAAIVAACMSAPQGGATSAGDIGGTVASSKRSRSRRVGDRRNDRPPRRSTPARRHDDRGRYLIPDLPKANYSVWTRGYGLVDSPKVQSAPGATLDLKRWSRPALQPRPTTTPGCTGTR